MKKMIFAALAALALVQESGGMEVQDATENPTVAASFLLHFPDYTHRVDITSNNEVRIGVPGIIMQRWFPRNKDAPIDEIRALLAKAMNQLGGTLAEINPTDEPGFEGTPERPRFERLDPDTIRLTMPGDGIRLPVDLGDFHMLLNPLIIEPVTSEDEIDNIRAQEPSISEIINALKSSFGCQVHYNG
jgi:hypothetical protein